MDADTATLVMIPNMVIGIIISIIGGVVAAIHTYSKERKQIPPTYDWVDFVTLSTSGAFSGFMGFLLASYFLESPNGILAVAGISAISGFGALLVVRDIGLDFLRHKLGQVSQMERDYPTQKYSTRGTEKDHSEIGDTEPAPTKHQENVDDSPI